MKYMKYRAIRYDQYDKMYAESLLALFRHLPAEVQQEFNELTGNLMSDTYINRNGLLSAISDYCSLRVERARADPKVIYFNIHDIVGWKAFNNRAFNYRPYF